MSIRIITFNLRCDSARQDGDNHFTKRLPLIVEAMASGQPDVMCLQEVTPTMLAALTQTLPDHAFYGHSRGGDYLQDEANPIAIRADRLNLHALDTCWLSPAPRQPASRHAQQSSCPRILTWVRLLDKPSGMVFTVVNTHLDHVSHQAKAAGLAQALQYAADHRAEHGCPVFLAGDFNFPPDNPLAAMWAASACPMVDLTAGSGATYHGFGQAKSPVKIDYILADADTAQAHEFTLTTWQKSRDGRYLSDHIALCVDWKFK